MQMGFMQLNFMKTINFLWSSYVFFCITIKTIDQIALFTVQQNDICATSFIGFIRSNKVTGKAGAA